jgi:hypothetical protein
MGSGFRGTIQKARKSHLTERTHHLHAPQKNNIKVRKDCSKVKSMFVMMLYSYVNEHYYDTSHHLQENVWSERPEKWNSGGFSSNIAMHLFAWL